MSYVPFSSPSSVDPLLESVCYYLRTRIPSFSVPATLPIRWHPLVARDSAGKFEIESADDFVTTASQTSITSATFTGLLTGGATTANVGAVTVEIYRVFPNDSNVARTSGPPTFSTLQVPTRVNSPSDVELVDRSTTSGNLSFTTTVLVADVYSTEFCSAGGHPSHARSNHRRRRINHRARGTIHGKLHDTYQSFARSLLLRAPSGGDTAVASSSGCRVLVRSFHRTHSQQALPICRAGRVTQCLIQTGSASERTLSDGVTPTFNAAFSLDGVATPLPGALPLFATGLGVGSAWLAQEAEASCCCRVASLKRTTSRPQKKGMFRLQHHSASYGTKRTCAVLWRMRGSYSTWLATN